MKLWPKKASFDLLASVAMVIAASLIVATLPLGAVANAPSDADSSSKAEAVRRIEHRLDLVRHRVVLLERVARRFRTWMRCVQLIPVDEAGDPNRRFGFLYDQLDGSGLDYRPALVRHRGPGRPDYALVAMEPRRACRSAAVTANGTGADAKDAQASVLKQTSQSRSHASRVRSLERRITKLESRIAILNRAADRFDDWESCLSALPVTEQGDPVRRYGHYFRGINARTYRHALGIDRSEWDDPDYQLLAFVGRDRPFTRRECSRDPGEAADKQSPPLAKGIGPTAPSKRNALADDILQIAVDSRELAEDIPDLRTALTEFTSFDECMFLVGVSNLGSTRRGIGYVYAGPHGRKMLRPALGLAMDGEVEPRWDVMAFPGEEPPQIECNEDASGQETEE